MQSFEKRKERIASCWEKITRIDERIYNIEKEIEDLKVELARNIGKRNKYQNVINENCQILDDCGMKQYKTMVKDLAHLIIDHEEKKINLPFKELTSGNYFDTGRLINNLDKEGYRIDYGRQIIIFESDDESYEEE